VGRHFCGLAGVRCWFAGTRLALAGFWITLHPVTCPRCPTGGDRVQGGGGQQTRSMPSRSVLSLAGSCVVMTNSRLGCELSPAPLNRTSDPNGVNCVTPNLGVGLCFVGIWVPRLRFADDVRGMQFLAIVALQGDCCGRSLHLGAAPVSTRVHFLMFNVAPPSRSTELGSDARSPPTSSVSMGARSKTNSTVSPSTARPPSQTCCPFDPNGERSPPLGRLKSERS
jgi:hypothetical protein